MKQNKNASVILFDVNETMLDMSPVKKKVNTILGNDSGFRTWFGMLLHYSLVENCTGTYHDFAAIANATLGMAAKALQKEIAEEDIKETLAMMKQLAAYPDVKIGLQLLQDAGYHLATLTNSPTQTHAQQLVHAGLTSYFEKTMSVDAVQKYKPAADTYRYAAQTLGVNTSNIIMVAAHGWDIAGAMQAGLQAAFIGREGQTQYPLAPTPAYTGKDLVEVANAIIQQQ